MMKMGNIHRIGLMCVLSLSLFLTACGQNAKGGKLTVEGKKSAQSNSSIEKITKSDA
jgi:hypothetical protein